MIKIIESGEHFERKKFDDFCKKNNFVFPEEFIEFLVINNDNEFEPNVIESFEDEGYYIRYFYGTTKENYSDLENNYNAYKERLPKKCIPIADPDFGNQICISLNEENYGYIYFWDHEKMDTEYGGICKLTFEKMILMFKSFKHLIDNVKMI